MNKSRQPRKKRSKNWLLYTKQLIKMNQNGTIDRMKMSNVIQPIKISFFILLLPRSRLVYCKCIYSLINLMVFLEKEKNLHSNFLATLNISYTLTRLSTWEFCYFIRSRSKRPWYIEFGISWNDHVWKISNKVGWLLLFNCKFDKLQSFKCCCFNIFEASMRFRVICK